MRILVDSTVWIDFFRKLQTTQTLYLKKVLLSGEDVAICGHIFSEVLRGVRSDEQYDKVLRNFSPEFSSFVKKIEPKTSTTEELSRL